MARRLFEEASHAVSYAKFRPSYPRELVEAILSYCKKHGCGRQTAVDVGCGSGQSTKLIAQEYAETVGVDVSPEQIRQANAGLTESVHTMGVSYIISEGENLPMVSGSVDLVTCSQAYHWLNWDRFHREMKRILRSPGCLAVYGYGLPQPQIEDAKQLMAELYGGTLKGYWDERRHYVDNCYRDFHLPYKHFMRDDSMNTVIQTTIGGFVGYVSTWSGYQSYRKQHPDCDPLEEFRQKLVEVVAPAKCEAPLETPMTTVAPLFLLLGIN